MKRHFWAAVAFIGLVIGLISCANAQEPDRIALLIGNQGYAKAVGPLQKTHQDIEVVGRALNKLGFKVTAIPDANYRQMDIAIRRHVARVRAAGPGTISFFYYSGHGIANPDTGKNYLVPVDVEQADTDNIWFESFEQSLLIDRLNRQARNAIHFVVLDACRNELNLTSSGKKTLGVEKGFRPVNDVRGMLIAYATAERKTAADTGDFARILAEEIVKPGAEAVSAFRRVQLRVEQTLGQEPWMSLNYLPETYLAGRKRDAGEHAAPITQPESRPGTSPAAEAWALVRDTQLIEELEAFIVHYGDTPFGDFARARLAQLQERRERSSCSASEPVIYGGIKFSLAARYSERGSAQPTISMFVKMTNTSEDPLEIIRLGNARVRTDVGLTAGGHISDMPDCGTDNAQWCADYLKSGRVKPLKIEARGIAIFSIGTSARRSDADAFKGIFSSNFMIRTIANGTPEAANLHSIKLEAPLCKNIVQ